MTRPPVIGIDIGGTKILGWLVDPGDPTVALARLRLPTPVGPQQLMATLVDVVERLAGDIDGGPVPVAVGIGIAGLVGRDGVLRYGPNLNGVTDLDLRRGLGDVVGIPVAVGNDADCAALAEARLGAGMGVSNMVLVTLGTGIGGGIVVDGALWRGANGFAGEPGHMVVDPDGPLCPCGRRGCWERFASGSGLRSLARRRAHEGLLDVVVDMVGGDPEAVTAEMLVEAARGADPDALAAMEEFGGLVALGVANLVNIFDPDMVVLGGGLTDAGALLVEPVRAAMAGVPVGSAHRPPVAIELAHLGHAAGAMGAALLAAEIASGAQSSKG